MKKALLLFAALLVAGCGEKSSSEGSESTSEKPTPSNESAEPSGDTAKPPTAESPSEEPSDPPNSLSDADVERLLKEAVDRDSIEEREDLVYRVNESEPYSGWVKSMLRSGVKGGLYRYKDGKLDGLMTQWHENGQKKDETTFKDGKKDGHSTMWWMTGGREQKRSEGTFKDGKGDGLWTRWDENGQKRLEGTYKDGETVSEKYWNRKGEEVETEKESSK